MEINPIPTSGIDGSLDGQTDGGLKDRQIIAKILQGMLDWTPADGYSFSDAASFAAAVQAADQIFQLYGAKIQASDPKLYGELKEILETPGTDYGTNGQSLVQSAQNDPDGLWQQMQNIFQNNPSTADMVFFQTTLQHLFAYTADRTDPWSNITDPSDRAFLTQFMKDLQLLSSANPKDFLKYANEIKKAHSIFSKYKNNLPPTLKSAFEAIFNGTGNTFSYPHQNNDGSFTTVSFSININGKSLLDLANEIITNNPNGKADFQQLQKVLMQQPNFAGGQSCAMLVLFYTMNAINFEPGGVNPDGSLQADPDADGGPDPDGGITKLFFTP